MNKKTQIIKKDGKPEWAVIPYEEYIELKELVALTDEVKQFRQALDEGEEELLPESFALRLIKGENPIRVWREYRNLTQASLAKSINISIPYLSQIENGERNASTQTLKKLANKLKVSINDLIL